MCVCAHYPYIYNICKKNNVIENGEKMHKEFHKQLDYIISEMKRKKKKQDHLLSMMILLDQQKIIIPSVFAERLFLICRRQIK